MTNFETELQRTRRELYGLAQDIDPAFLAGESSWGELVPAAHSLGREIRVTRLDLAAEFLAVLSERDQLLKRISLHRAVDLHGDVFDDEVESLARRLQEDESLVQLLGARLHEAGTHRLRGRLLEYQDVPLLEEGEADEADTLADHVLHETVEAERDRLLTEMLSGRDGIDPGLMQLVLDGADILQEAMMTGLSPNDFKALSRWLKSYRHTTLNYTWLSPSEDSKTPIQHLTTLMKNHESTPFGWLLQLSNDPEYAELGDEVYGIWEELAGLFGQIDFDHIIEDLKDGFPPFGPGGDDRINIVPGDDKVACKPVLLAFARGGGSRGKFAFENVMKAVKQHLIDCQDVLKLVVFMTDTWDSRKFMEDHFEELSSWRRRNIRFLFLGIGAPRDQIAPIAVDLN